MRGAPAKAIQELAGHENLMTTLRHIHLSPAARVGAIKLRNQRPAAAGEAQLSGDIMERGLSAPLICREKWVEALGIDLSCTTVGPVRALWQYRKGR
jgi:hypothetical protein